MEDVSWYDALVFCNKLSIAEGLSPAYSISGSTNPGDWGTVPTINDNTWNFPKIVAGSNGYRLPTEAQWEYAAKGGNDTPENYTYSGSNIVGDVAWYTSNSNGKTHEVGKKSPNSLGLYDMSGNVREWCWDNYSMYSVIIVFEAGDQVLRGGGFFSSAFEVRSAYRGHCYSYFRQPDIGFRLVRP